MEIRLTDTTFDFNNGLVNVKINIRLEQSMLWKYFLLLTNS